LIAVRRVVGVEEDARDMKQGSVKVKVLLSSIVKLKSKEAF
jgi:hypothetical protein